jgi:hypothetical protein
MTTKTRDNTRKSKIFSDGVEPSTYYREKHLPQWQTTMAQEIKALQTNNT